MEPAGAPLWLQELLSSRGVVAATAGAVARELELQTPLDLANHDGQGAAAWAALLGCMARIISVQQFDGLGVEEIMAEELGTALKPAAAVALAAPLLSSPPPQPSKRPRHAAATACHDPWALAQPLAVRSFITKLRRDDGVDGRRDYLVDCVCPTMYLMDCTTTFLARVPFVQA